MERDIENGRRITLPRIAVLVPSADYEEDWSAIKADYLRLFGPETAFLSWVDCGDLSSYDLITPLLAWGYPRDYARWERLLDRLEAENLPIINPVSVLRWNGDKVYLAELAAAGIATVPTLQTQALCAEDLDAAYAAFATDLLVVKPAISAGAYGTYKLARKDTIPQLVMGKRMMIQPYLSNITEEGEFSLFYFGGQFSHAVLKSPANGDFRVQDQFGGTERAVEAPEAANLLSVAALSAACRITGVAELAYARVDLLRATNGQFQLMELELIEPSLFLRFADDRGTAFAEKMLLSTS